MSNLPGSVTKLKGYFVYHCDAHPNKAAQYRLQGETDSFGAEYIYMCDDCYEEYKAEAKKPRIGQCDWCKTENVELKYARDPDEGSSGPVYDLCDCCCKKLHSRED